MNNIELIKSAENNVKTCWRGLEIMDSAISDVKRKGLTLENLFGVFCGGFISCVSVEAASNNLRQIGENVAAEIERKRRHELQLLALSGINPNYMLLLLHKRNH